LVKGYQVATTSNTPQERLVLRAAARKSWALSIQLFTETGARIDVTDAVITLVAAIVSPGGDITPVLEATAEPIAPMSGHVRFNLQADDTDLDAAEYDVTITMRTDGYSVPLAIGVLEIVPNTETDSVNYDYDDAEDASKLEIWLKRRNVIKISAPTIQSKGNTGETGPQGPVGPAGPGLAPGGAPGSVAIKHSYDDYDTTWAAPESLVPVPGTYMQVIDHGTYLEIQWLPVEDGGLSAAGAAEGMVPRAVGADAWGWDYLQADEILDGGGKVMMTDEERTKLASITGGSLASSDWDAAEGEDGYIYNKPTLGTASSHDHEDYRPSDWMPSLLELTDVDHGYELPESGPPGTFFILLPAPPEEP
jgi:hypothetical protein